MTNTVCERLRNILLDYRNNLPAIRAKLFRAKREQDDGKRREKALQFEIRQLELMIALGNGLGRAGPLGVVASVLTKAQAEIKKGRLEDELQRLKNRLPALKQIILNLENDEREHIHGVDKTEKEIIARRC